MPELPILNSFEHVVREWLTSVTHAVRDITHQKKIRRLELHTFPLIGTIAPLKYCPITQRLHDSFSPKTKFREALRENIIENVIAQLNYIFDSICCCHHKVGEGINECFFGGSEIIFFERRD
jgi:hypothetical protein